MASPLRLGTAVLALLALAACTARPAVRKGASQQLELVDSVETLDVLAREPMVVQHPDGTLFVAGYSGGIDTLWRSVDGGATWARVDVGAAAVGHLGNSDVDLAIAPDGTLYFASMSFDRKVNEGLGIAVGVSEDRGATWTWSTVSRQRFDDRPWVEVTPDGVAHLIWNDGSGVAHASSRDRGASWQPGGRVSERGGSSHLAVGPKGEIAVRVTPASASGKRFDAGVDVVAVSLDGGATWTTRELPGHREWSNDPDQEGPLPRWVEPLAWGPSGALFAAWTEADGVWVARSRDLGVSWSTWRIEPASTPAFYPYLIARADDDLVVSWFSLSRADAPDLSWHVTRVALDAGEGAPRVTRFPPRPVEGGRKQEDGNLAPDTGGEYLALVALRDGDIGVVTPLQNAPASRLGFSWWRLRLAPALSGPAAAAP